VLLSLALATFLAGIAWAQGRPGAAGNGVKADEDAPMRTEEYRALSLRLTLGAIAARKVSHAR